MSQIPDSNRKSSNARARELHLRLYAESESDFLKMGISYFCKAEFVFWKCKAAILIDHEGDEDSALSVTHPFEKMNSELKKKNQPTNKQTNKQTSIFSVCSLEVYVKISKATWMFDFNNSFNL